MSRSNVEDLMEIMLQQMRFHEEMVTTIVTERRSGQRIGFIQGFVNASRAAGISEQDIVDRLKHDVELTDNEAQIYVYDREPEGLEEWSKVAMPKRSWWDEPLTPELAEASKKYTDACLAMGMDEYTIYERSSKHFDLFTNEIRALVYPFRVV